MFRIFHDADKVVIDLMARRRDLLLSPLEAERMADALEEFAGLAEQALPSLFRGENWGVFVTTYGEQVVLRFTFPSLGLAERVPVPPRAARQIAELLRRNAETAGYRLRIETG